MAVAALLLTSSLALAQHGYELTWWAVADGGGKPSSAGGHSLGSTVGRPDAGLTMGGGYTLVRGFWGSVPAQWRIYLPLVVHNGTSC